VRKRLLQLVPDYFNPLAAMHHYRSMADRAIAQNLLDGSIGIKKLFCVLRPLLACRWIEHKGTQPPTEFQQLMTPAWVDSEEKNWLESLSEQKSMADEAQRISVDRLKLENIQSELERYKSAAELVAAPAKSNIAGLDELFREWIRDWANC